MIKISKRGLFHIALFSAILFSVPTANAQFFKKVLNKSKSSKKNKSSNKASATAAKGGKQFVSKNQMSSRFASGFTNLEMRTAKEKRKGNEFNVYHFGSGNKLAFKLYPRFAKDDYSRDIDGVYCSNFVKEGEEVFHIDELKDVTDTNGTKHSFTPVPSPSKRVIKTPDNVYLVYAFDGGKKIG